MLHNISYKCDNCGHEKEEPSGYGNHGGKCYQCSNGSYHQCGESYDQEWVDEQKYNQQQDREYEERHRYDDQY